MTHGMILILVTSGMLFLSQAYTERRNDPWFVLRLLADFWRTAFISLQQVVMTLRDISCKGVTCGHLFFFCVFVLHIMCCGFTNLLYVDVSFHHHFRHHLGSFGFPPRRWSADPSPVAGNPVVGNPTAPGLPGSQDELPPPSGVFFGRLK